MKLFLALIIIAAAAVGGLYIYGEQMSAPTAPVTYELEDEFPR